MTKTAELIPTERQLLFSRLADRLETAYNLSRKVVSFQANKDEPIYRWFKYKEGFSSTLVKYFLTEYCPKPGKLLDPFAGAGTTLFAGQELGWQSYGVELLPVGVFVMQTREALNGIDTEKLRTTIKNLWAEFLYSFKIPLPPLTIQQEIVSKIEQYEKIIAGAKQVVENYKPQIDIKPEWDIVELGKILKLSSGRGLTQQNMVEGEFPVYGGNGINGYHNEYFIENPIIVIGRVGAYCGSIIITQPKSWVTDNGLYVTEYLIEINQDYLAQVLSQLELNKYAKVGGQPSISQSTVYERQIPIPTLAEQELIVAQIENEKQLVNASKELINIYEQKIKDEINKLWEE